LHAIAKLFDHQASISHSRPREQFKEIALFVQATIFSGVNNDMRIACEEIFALLSLIPYRDEEDAITIVNHTDYGLQTQFFSSDTTRGRLVADRFRSRARHSQWRAS
jgi:aldehyde dehydrogenase (NAD+)